MVDKETVENFGEIFKNQIMPEARKLEAYRIEENGKRGVLHKILIIFLIMVVLSAIIIFNEHFSSIVNIGVSGFLISLLMCAITALISHKIADDYRKKIKPILLKPILSVLGDFEIKEKEILSLKEIKTMGLFLKAGQKADDDNITGFYKNKSISFIETSLFHSQNKSTVTDFDGLIIKIELNNFFEGTITGVQNMNGKVYADFIKQIASQNPEVVPKWQLDALDSPLYQNLYKMAENSQKNKVSIQDGCLHIDLSGFNKDKQLTKTLKRAEIKNPNYDLYKIYSDNIGEAEALLTDKFADKLKDIRKTLCVLSTDFVFKNNNLYLFLENAAIAKDMAMPKAGGEFCPPNGKGFFEVGSINKTLLDKNIYLKLFKELVAVLSVVDCFIVEENKQK